MLWSDIAVRPDVRRPEGLEVFEDSIPHWMKCCVKLHAENSKEDWKRDSGFKDLQSEETFRMFWFVVEKGTMSHDPLHHIPEVTALEDALRKHLG